MRLHGLLQLWEDTLLPLTIARKVALSSLSCIWLAQSTFNLPLQAKTVEPVTQKRLDPEKRKVKPATIMPRKTDPSSRPIVRLPRDVVPHGYEIELEPDLKRFTFQGTVVIDLEAKKPVHEVVINASDLKVSDAQLVSTAKKDNSVDSHPIKVVKDAINDKIRFVSARQLPAGAYKLSLRFAGVLSDKLSGFYRSSFKDDKNVKHWLCATQLEPMDARRMFPCFDEPDFKATFRLKVVIPSDLTAISNSEIESIEVKNSKKHITFAPTVKMSSYLLALVVGDFKECGEKTVAGVPIKVWAVSGKEHMGQYALEEAARAFEYQSNYFGIAYPGKKLDLIAVPDFGSEGMENLGAITFNESQLLADKNSSLHARKDITSLIAHEIAHQWFGNLVTMRWWDALWLNEAFATWMATKTSDALHPDWRVLTESIANRGGMNVDSLSCTRAVYDKVNTPGEVNEMFDSITYEKGESVLRMLEGFVGQSSFRDGVRNYLRDHAYGNASTEDLWHAISACSNGAPVEAIMKSFIYLPGVPLVKVSLAADGLTLTAEQTRYFTLGERKEDNSRWEIPLVLRSLLTAVETSKQAPFAHQNDSAGGALTSVLKEKEERIKLPQDWTGVFVNACGTGYYHTQYSEHIFAEVKKHFSSLSAEEKLTVISDADALTLSGQVPVEECCDFISTLKTENDHLVQLYLCRQLSNAHRLINDTGMRSYERFVQSILAPIKRKLGWQARAGESEGETRLRAYVLGLLGTYGQDHETIAEARQYFARYCKDSRSIDPDLVDSVLTIVSYNGGAAEYNQLLALSRNSDVPAERELALYSLAGFRKKALVEKTLNYAISDEVRLQDGLELINAAASMRESRPATWAFIKAHWTKLINRFPEDHLHILASALGHVENHEQEKEVKAWLSSHPIPHAKTAIVRMEEEMHLFLLRKDRLSERINRWFERQGAN